MGRAAGAGAREADYWPTLIGRTKDAHPGLLFVAEVYWDMEWAMQQQGFDLCYDKRLYDRLAHESAESVRAHLQADTSYQKRLIRFIGTATKPRGVRFADLPKPEQPRLSGPRWRVRVSSTTADLDGRRTRIPVFLGRGPDEPPDGDLRSFYARLLRAVAEADLRDGDWRLCECRGWPDDDSYRRLVSWCWSSSESRRGAGRGQPLRHSRAGTGAPAMGRPPGTNLGADRQA